MKKFKMKYRNEIVAYTLLAYPLFHWSVFFLIALGRSLYISLTDWNLMRDPRFIGLDNYINILTDSDTITIFINTVIWTLVMTVGHNLLGLLMAYILNEIPKGEKLFRALLYWPVLVSLVVGAQMIEFIFDPSPFGMLNSVIVSLGFEAKTWFQDPKLALLSLMLFPMATGFGMKMLIYQAGMKGIPKSLYEAGKIDGATNVQNFFHITLPLLSPVIFLNLVLSVINGFRVLGPMQLVTNGGPLNATETVVLTIYKEGFVYNDMGFASAMAFILFAVILMLTIIQFKLKKDEVSYE